MDKVTKAAAEYGPATGTRCCALCRSYLPPAGCLRVEGDISPRDGCKLFVLDLGKLSAEWTTYSNGW